MLHFKIKTLWFGNTLGLAIDQIYANRRIPLTKYYFWPRHDAWNMIKNELGAKVWLAEEDKVAVLELITQLLNSWQKSIEEKTSCSFPYQQKEIDFVGME